MKILFVTNYNYTVRASGGYINDYLNDLTFYGLKSLPGLEVVDSTEILNLYVANKPKIHPSRIWGGGMSASWLLDDSIADRTNIEDKIKDRFYDYIIYGSIKRCNQYYELVERYYPPSKVVLIDGDDDTVVHPLHEKHLYFKRELTEKIKNVHPISFSIPSVKIVNQKVEKLFEYGTCIPGDTSTYIFKDEKSYYENYQQSYYGVTMKKAGWDCMRHYEILANACVPYFLGLENCPSLTMVNFPKQLVIEGRNLAEEFDESRYFLILNELLEYTRNTLTSETAAKRILEYLI